MEEKEKEIVEWAEAEIRRHLEMSATAEGKGRGVSKAIYSTSSVTNFLLLHILVESRSRDRKLDRALEELKGIQREVAKSADLVERLEQVRQDMWTQYSSMFDLVQGLGVAIENVDTEIGNQSKVEPEYFASTTSCTGCGKRVGNNAQYCPYCGEEQ